MKRKNSQSTQIFGCIHSSLDQFTAPGTTNKIEDYCLRPQSFLQQLVYSLEQYLCSAGLGDSPVTESVGSKKKTAGKC